jgi:hypothetical protein
MHVRFGQRGVATVAPLCHLISYIIISVHPPYPVLVVMFIFVGFGNGLEDAAWCAWIGNMASAMVSKAGLEWYAFYYIMVCQPYSSFVRF